MKNIALFLVALLFTGCARPHLSVRSEHYSRQQLASYAIDTPDPRKDSNDFGQRLFINWSVPEKTFKEGPLELILQVRLKNGEEKSNKILLKKREGQTFYPIFGNDYMKKGGMQSYL